MPGFTGFCIVLQITQHQSPEVRITLGHSDSCDSLAGCKAYICLWTCFLLLDRLSLLLVLLNDWWNWLVEVKKPSREWFVSVAGRTHGLPF